MTVNSGNSLKCMQNSNTSICKAFIGYESFTFIVDLTDTNILSSLVPAFQPQLQQQSQTKAGRGFGMRRGSWKGGGKVGRARSFDKLKLLIAIIINMGQGESAPPAEDSCFHTCLQEKKRISHKTHAVPVPRPQEISFMRYFTPPPPKQPADPQPPSPHQQPQPANPLQTSQHPQTPTKPTDTPCKSSRGTAASDEKGRESVQNDSQGEAKAEVVLEIQSKYSSGKRAMGLSGNNLTKVSSSYEHAAITTGTPLASTDNLGSVNSFGGSRALSRNLLLNKIEQIKQKYYQRELQIEIYINEHDYQEQLQQIDSIRQYQQRNQTLPHHSVQEISAIRDRIIAILNHQRHKQGNSNITGQEMQDLSVTTFDKLEIYSRDGQAVLDDSNSKSERDVRYSRRDRLNLSRSKQILDKSLDKSVNKSTDSFEEKVEFSDYSNESLQEIRELDEEDEEYKSKMVQSIQRQQQAQPTQQQQNIAASSKLSKLFPPPSRLSNLAPNPSRLKPSQPPNSKLVSLSAFELSKQSSFRVSDDQERVGGYGQAGQVGIAERTPSQVQQTREAACGQSSKLVRF